MTCSIFSQNIDLTGKTLSYLDGKITHDIAFLQNGSFMEQTQLLGTTHLYTGKWSMGDASTVKMDYENHPKKAFPNEHVFLEKEAREDRGFRLELEIVDNTLEENLPFNGAIYFYGYDKREDMFIKTDGNGCVFISLSENCPFEYFSIGNGIVLMPFQMELEDLKGFNSKIRITLNRGGDYVLKNSDAIRHLKLSETELGVFEVNLDGFSITATLAKSAPKED